MSCRRSLRRSDRRGNGSGRLTALVLALIDELLVSARHSGRPQLSASRAFCAAGAVRAGLRRARGYRTVHPRHPHGAAQIPQPDDVAHSRTDARLALCHCKRPCEPRRSAAAVRSCNVRYSGVPAWHRAPVGAGRSAPRDGAQGPARADRAEGGEPVVNLDWSILHWIQSTLICPLMDFLMPKITLLGNGGVIWILAVVILLCTKKYRRQGVLLLAGLVVGVLVGNVCLKHLIARPRPCWLDSSVQLLIANPTDYSFPSGHALSSVISATVLTKTNRCFGYAAIPLAALIAFSRLYLYVHFPSDVLAAAVLGIVIGELAFRYGNRLLDRHKLLTVN